MLRKGKRNVWKIVVLTFLLFVLTVLCIWKLFYVRRSVDYDSTGEVHYNPLMGFAVNADYPDAVGENTLVYVDITWREWEPEEGVYAVGEIKEANYWERWKEEGRCYYCGERVIPGKKTCKKHYAALSQRAAEMNEYKNTINARRKNKIEHGRRSD